MRHGLGGFKSGCRCDRCTAATQEYMRSYYLDKKDGLRRLVDAGPARAHLLLLQQCGLGYRPISDAADVDQQTLVAIRLGRVTRIRRSTEAKILSVTGDAVADGTKVPARRCHQMLRELVSEGYTRAQIARALGFKRGCLKPLYRTRVTAKTEMRVKKLYRRSFYERLAE